MLLCFPIWCSRNCEQVRYFFSDLCDWNSLISFIDIFNPATKASTSCQMPPLPTSLPDMTSPAYPQIYRLLICCFTCTPTSFSSIHSNYKTTITPRNNNNNRPNTANNVAAPSRITNTFAALFGASNYAKPSNPPVVSASPPTSLHSFDSGKDLHAPIEVSAFTIDRRIVRKEIGREMNKILKAELKASTSFGNIPMPSWIVERVQDMTATWYILSSPSSSPLKKKTTSEKKMSSIGCFCQPSCRKPR